MFSNILFYLFFREQLTNNRIFRHPSCILSLILSLVLSTKHNKITTLSSLPILNFSTKNKNLIYAREKWHFSVNGALPTE